MYALLSLASYIPADTASLVLAEDIEQIRFLEDAKIFNVASYMRTPDANEEKTLFRHDITFLVQLHSEMRELHSGTRWFPLDDLLITNDNSFELPLRRMAKKAIAVENHSV